MNTYNPIKKTVKDVEFTKEELDNEIWKDIPTFEGLYQCSNLGRIKSLDRVNINPNGRKFHVKERILKPSYCRKKYYQIHLVKENQDKTRKVHLLVSMTFLGHKPDGTTTIVVDHINNNRSDNRVENIQLISNRENSCKDRTNKYGIRGVSVRDGKYKAEIRHKNIRYYLGDYSTAEEAGRAYQKALLNLDGLKRKDKPKSSKYRFVGKYRDKWVARPYIDKVRFHLGYYKTEEEANNRVQEFLKTR